MKKTRATDSSKLEESDKQQALTRGRPAKKESDGQQAERRIESSARPTMKIATVPRSFARLYFASRSGACWPS